MNEYIETVVRTTLGFFILLILTRLVGKKQLGQLNIFTYITGIALGNMAGDMIIHRDVKIIDGIIGMVLWSAFVLIVEYTGMKSARTRVWLDGEPTIVIKKGQINEKALKKLRLNMDDLSMLLRVNQVFSILDVHYAVLEPNGELSVLKKSNKQSATKGDIQVPASDGLIPSEIIVDGKIVKKNLIELNYPEYELTAELSRQSIFDVKTVLYAELQADRSLHVQIRG